MYNIQIKCTYQNLDNGSQELAELTEEKYREEFLQVFGVEDYCDETVNTIILDLHKKIKDSDDQRMNDLLKKMASIFMSQDPEIGLMVGFSYSYFYLMHPCVCHLLTSGTICTESFDALNLEVEKNIK